MPEQKLGFGTNLMIIVGAGILGTMISSGIVYLLTLYFKGYFGGFSKKVADDVAKTTQESWEHDDS